MAHDTFGGGVGRLVRMGTGLGTWWREHVSVRDDRGQKLPRSTDARPNYALLPRETRKAVERAWWVDWRAGLVGAGFAVGFFLVQAAARKIAGAMGVSGVIATALIAFAAGIPVIYATIIVLVPRLLRKHIRVARSVGYCASCWYPLRDVRTAMDGCTVCPECGAAWRLDAGVGGGA